MQSSGEAAVLEHLTWRLAHPLHAWWDTPRPTPRAGGTCCAPFRALGVSAGDSVQLSATAC